jgi:hypothetical protein
MISKVLLLDDYTKRTMKREWRKQHRDSAYEIVARELSKVFFREKGGFLFTVYLRVETVMKH